MANSVPSPRSGDLPRGRRSPSARPRLAGFAGATFIVASNLAGWWGTPQSPLALAPFAAMFGGLAQFMAGMWAYRARDAIATLAHGTWGSFWLAYLILNILVGAHVVTQPTPWYHNPEVGFWFFALAITTTIAAWRRSPRASAWWPSCRRWPPARESSPARSSTGRTVGRRSPAGCSSSRPARLVHGCGDAARVGDRPNDPAHLQVQACGERPGQAPHASHRARVGRAGDQDGPVGRARRRVRLPTPSLLRPAAAPSHRAAQEV